MTTKNEVDDYLRRVRKLVDAGNALLIGRPKNLDALVDMGMSKVAVIRQVASLSATDYCSGPDADKDREGQYCWVFGREIGNVDVYIKLVIEDLAGGRQRLKVLSFHQAEWAMRYPFG